MQTEHETDGTNEAPAAEMSARRRWRRPPFRPLGLGLAALLGILLALFLLVDFNLSYERSQTEASHSIVTAKGMPRPIGDQLQVYLADGANLPGLEEALIAAAKESELPFTELKFVDELPTEAMENPVLAIRVLDDGGFWTPAFASRKMKVRFYYAQGWSVDREAVLNPVGESRRAGGSEGCQGACAQGERDLTLGARSVGLISLPHMRAYVAEALAKEAVLLVKGGLPENLDTERWHSRAGNLAREQLPKGESMWSSFQRIPGCMGGVVFVGEANGPGGDWSLMYYDAVQDQITEKLTQAAFAALAGERLGLSGIQGLGSPGFGGSDREFGIYFPTTGGGIRATIPPGQCGLSNLTFSR
ncbi:MAG: hypothetical protein K0R39_4172 [Symbiobacteriaceae bacterium]|nr:hypothetical protein [Symbiobacteriaceae bacterium]